MNTRKLFGPMYSIRQEFLDKAPDWLYLFDTKGATIPVLVVHVNGSAFSDSFIVFRLSTFADWFLNSIPDSEGDEDEILV